ncbi:hypothetical protein BKA67DRAFT_695943 [Truncatella angustata]|uniref:Uncharacterized protein n=1 Tax=Truncatella angustata TaxID=152316 RepID=A0A9P8RMB8_9PEZI|nr:uncharacterized protein BKA67DRAFT_695943 [Truncatella angustata]KAH6646020.1 hypothetical protein BKA67DRAFT_695943 [Truncatella angustata]
MAANKEEGVSPVDNATNSNNNNNNNTSAVAAPAAAVAPAAPAAPAVAGSAAAPAAAVAPVAPGASGASGAAGAAGAAGVPASAAATNAAAAAARARVLGLLAGCSPRFWESLIQTRQVVKYKCTEHKWGHPTTPCGTIITAKDRNILSHLSKMHRGNSAYKRAASTDRPVRRCIRGDCDRGPWSNLNSYNEHVRNSHGLDMTEAQIMGNLKANARLRNDQSDAWYDYAPPEGKKTTTRRQKRETQEAEEGARKRRRTRSTRRVVLSSDSESDSDKGSDEEPLPEGPFFWDGHENGGRDGAGGAGGGMVT